MERRPIRGFDATGTGGGWVGHAGRAAGRPVKTAGGTDVVRARRYPDGGVAATRRPGQRMRARPNARSESVERQGVDHGSEPPRHRRVGRLEMHHGTLQPTPERGRWRLLPQCISDVVLERSEPLAKAGIRGVRAREIRMELLEDLPKFVSIHCPP
jgi:hypothetical protein